MSNHRQIIVLYFYRFVQTVVGRRTLIRIEDFVAVEASFEEERCLRIAMVEADAMNAELKAHMVRILRFAFCVLTVVFCVLLLLSRHPTPHPSDPTPTPLPLASPSPSAGRPPRRCRCA